MTCPEPSRRVDDALLAILACPACQGDVKLLDVTSGDFIPSTPKGRSEGSPISSKPAGRSERSVYKIVCTRCGRRYPIKDGIPVLLADEAEK